MVEKLLVTKRDGSTELLDLNKIHKVLFWAVEDISTVSVSEIEIKTKMQLYNKISTSEIHETLIKSAANLTSEESPNYQYVAARLAIFTLRKQVYGQFDPPFLYDHVKKCVDAGVYDKSIIDMYDMDEWKHLDRIVKHDRDLLLTYVAVEQFRGKYLIQDRTTGEYYETPQMAYILLSCVLFNKYPKETRIKYVKQYYDLISKGSKALVTIPTPLIGGVRSPTKQFSSCCLIDSGDSLESINETTSAIADYASLRSGIGINAGRIRAKGSSVRNGEVYHTGNIPYYKYMLGALKSCSQGGLRGASATTYFPIFHYEVEDLIVLKNNKGTEETRVRHMDYAVQINKLFYERLRDDGKITLFSPHDVEDLYAAFFSDSVKFTELYEKYERATSVRKKTVGARELFEKILIERNNTGRIYIHNVDHSNTAGAFNAETSPVMMSNLCLEILLPTAPLTKVGREKMDNDKMMKQFNGVTPSDFRDKYGEIALCTLSSINLGAITDVEQLEYVCDLTIRALDELLDYQNYPMIASGVPALKRRSLGVGVCNLAYFIAKHGCKYSDGSANELVNKYAEAISYYLIKASMNLAKEKGPCDWFSETKYARGIMPIDTYKNFTDTLIDTPSHMDWDSLREDVMKYGMRNSTVMALMPVETSSQVINATNGIEPPRSAISIKTSKHGVFKQVVPEFSKLKNKYEYLWDMPNTRGYLEVAAMFQRWTDQSISTNTTYNPANYDGNKIPMSELLLDLTYAYALGLKTLYYQNTYDGSGDIYVDDSNGGSVSLPTESLSEDDEDDCSSCKL